MKKICYLPNILKIIIYNNYSSQIYNRFNLTMPIDPKTEKYVKILITKYIGISIDEVERRIDKGYILIFAAPRAYLIVDDESDVVNKIHVFNEVIKHIKINKKKIKHVDIISKKVPGHSVIKYINDTSANAAIKYRLCKQEWFGMELPLRPDAHKYKIIKKNERDELKYIDIKNLPKIMLGVNRSDPMLVWYNASVGDIVQIERPFGAPKYALVVQSFCCAK